ncbi:putative het domain protein [Neofusicoccum parvum UCRNP2]|uniref:Putative het domain protein n=1 Tax=Botryosphaeria parva (strain UCR-NP2) TaxID=1287680 RepID=R1GY61_BOTPV|nr:putative het domain protein [Neofusicoccum parvum UCRNP2]
MSIDVRERDIGTYEALLAALLVSDWNVRAWTLLEGYQGAANIHLLCKHDETLRLADVIAAVHTAGDMVLANMSMATEHLFPPRESAHTTTTTTTTTTKPADPQDKRFKPSLVQSGRLLSHRHASRAGDEIVIWSLLRGHLSHTAAAFWRSQQTVDTGFLVSDVPRIPGSPGLSWAPARPDLPPAADTSTRRRRFASEGANTEVGGITEDGLRAFWLVCAFGDAGFRRGAGGWLATRVAQVREIVAGRVPLIDSWIRNCDARADYYRGMWLLPAAARRRLDGIAAEVGVSAGRLALLQAVESGPYYTDLPYAYQGDGEDALLVVVEKNEGGNWVWRKVVVWDADVPLPPFTRQRILIQ